jgi:hypothetical protein
MRRFLVWNPCTGKKPGANATEETGDYAHCRTRSARPVSQHRYRHSIRPREVLPALDPRARERMGSASLIEEERYVVVSVLTLPPQHRC